MGMFYSKAPEKSIEPKLSYEFLCNALTKWYGEAAFLAHVIYLNDFGTSYISEVVQWRVCAQHGGGQDYAELVFKFHPWIKARGCTFRTADFFKNEIKFYENVLPELLKFQNAKEISRGFDNHAKLCFSYWDGDDDSICLGNLKVQGFGNAKESMDVEHGKLILQTLARFHALSFALKIENREKFESISRKLSETYYSQNYWGWYKKLWSQLCAVAINAVQNEYPDSDYVKKTKEFAVPKRYKDLVKAVEDRENSVILHGDCTTSNYMFKYIDDTPVEVKMVDFQQARCASPALDVSCILFNNRQLFKDTDALLRYYHGNLVTRIIELGSDPGVYMFDTFMEDVKKYSFFGLAFSFEAACINVTRDDIFEKLNVWDSGRIVNIADVYEIKNLENQERLDLADVIVHCINNGYI